MLTATEPHTVQKDARLASSIERARTDFAAYVMLLNPPRSGYVLSEVHLYLLEMIQEIVDGKRGKRQAVSLPPQHGKSRILSVEAPAWLMGRMPEIQLAITGYSQDLTVGFAKQVRSRLGAPLHLSIFPTATPKEGSNRADAFECENGSSLRAKSVGAKLTGRKVDWLVVDDPHSGREEAESVAQRKKVKDWYDADCFTRLSPNASVFLIQTRWHPEDLVGQLTNEDRVLELMALNQPDEVFEVTNFPAVAVENDVLGRTPGEALFPEIRTEKFLSAVKAALPSYEWDSQYMGDPKGHSGEQFDVKNLRYVEKLEQVPWDKLELVRGWDLALTEEQTSDFSVGLLGGYDPTQDHFYVLDVFRNKANWVKNRKIMLDMARREACWFPAGGADEDCWFPSDAAPKGGKVMRIGIEAVAGFLATYQDVKAQLMGELKVEPRNPPSGDKLTRALPWLNKIEAKRFFMLRAPWNKEYVAELKLFPDGTYDDQVDATSIAWEMLTGRHRHGLLGRDGKPLERGFVRPSSSNRPTGSGRMRVIDLGAKNEKKVNGSVATTSPEIKEG